MIDRLDEFLKVYHSSLCETLGEFGLSAEKVYPFQTMKEEWKRYSKYALPLSLAVWKVKLGDKDCIPDITKDTITWHVGEDLKAEYKQRVRDLILHLYSNDFL